MRPGVETYIGDGVYLCWAPDGDPMHIRLRTARETADHTIYLEPEMLAAIVRFLAQPDIPEVWFKFINKAVALAVEDIERQIIDARS